MGRRAYESEKIIRLHQNQNDPPLPMICERVRYYRKLRKMEQKELARKLDITANAVTNWESGRSRPDVALIPKLCRALGISLYDLYGMEDPQRYTKKEEKLIENYRELKTGNQALVDGLIGNMLRIQNAQTETLPKLIRLLSFQKPLAAGIGDPTEFEQEAKPIWLYASPEVDRADYVFSVNGDSMEPEFRSGDLVLVQKLSGSSSLRFGEIGAFIVGNETYIKEYREDGLHSLNQNYEVLRFADEEPVYLIGRVLGIASPEEIAGEEDIEAFLTIHGAAG